MYLPKVGIIVLNWNGKEDTLECLESLRRMDYENAEVIVVDNGSTDGSQRAVLEKFDDVHLAELGRNMGVSAGYNAGLKVAMRRGCELFLCMNNDIVVEENFLSELVETLVTEKEVGIVYPAVFSYDDRRRIDNLGGRIHLFTGTNSRIGEGRYGFDEVEIHADYTDTPLMRKEVLDSIGLWDEEYFAYYEDVDLCLRAQMAGWSIKCNPRARIYHKKGRTSSKVRGLVSYFSVRNRIKFVRKFGNPWHYAVTLMHIILLTFPTIFIKRAIERNYKHVPRYFLMGFLDGFLSRYGRFPDFS